MATRKQVLAKIAELGATLDTDHEENSTSLCVDAPRGYTFTANGHWSLSEQYRNFGGQSWKSQAYVNLMESLADGIEPMTAEERERYEYECDEDLSDVPGIVALPNKAKVNNA